VTDNVGVDGRDNQIPGRTWTRRKAHVSMVRHAENQTLLLNAGSPPSNMSLYKRPSGPGRTSQPNRYSAVSCEDEVLPVRPPLLCGERFTFDHTLPRNHHQLKEGIDCDQYCHASRRGRSTMLDNDRPAASGENPTPEIYHPLPIEPVNLRGNELLRIQLGRESSTDNLLAAAPTSRRRRSGTEWAELVRIGEKVNSAFVVAKSSKTPLATIIIKFEQARVELLQLQFRVEAITHKSKRAMLLESLSRSQTVINTALQGFRRLQPSKADERRSRVHKFFRNNYSTDSPIIKQSLPVRQRESSASSLNMLNILHGSESRLQASVAPVG